MARAQLEHLSEQDQHGDDDGGVEVGLDRPVHADAGGKQLRDDGRDGAVAVRRADAEADQREHVRAAVHDRRHIRWKNGQPHQSTTGVASAKPIQLIHGRRRGDGESVPPLSMSPIVSRNTGAPESDADPEAPRHVDELGVRRVRQIGDARLERHPAFRTGARAGRSAPPDPSGRSTSRRRLSDCVIARIAGADCRCAGWVLRFRPPIVRSRCGAAAIGSRVPGQVLLRVGAELRDAAFRAEVVRRAVVIDVPAARAGSTVIPQTGSSAMTSATRRQQLRGRREPRLDVDRHGGQLVERLLHAAAARRRAGRRAPCAFA